LSVGELHGEELGMSLTESSRRKLLLTSTGLVLTSLIGTAAASRWIDGFSPDWPMVGVMVATVAAAGAELSKANRPGVSRWLARISIALTVVCASLVLFRIFG
jgi:hypothetical protein